MPGPVHPSEPGTGRSPVIACIGAAMHARAVAQASARLARQARKPLILFHAIGEHRLHGSLPDPFGCQIDRKRMHAALAELKQTIGPVADGVSVALGEGYWPSDLTEMVAREGAAIAVAGTPCSGHASHLATSILEGGMAACMFVSGQEATAEAVPARRRIMVPLDGSAFSEAALAQAIRLATAESAELLLVHVIPECGIEDFGPPSVRDLALRGQIDRRNEQSAREFLETRLQQVRAHGLAARSSCTKGDPRVRLVDFVARERPTMVVMSARGAGIRTCEDLAIGSTAGFLLDHLKLPVLVVANAAQARSHALWTGRHLPLSQPGRPSVSQVASTRS